MPTLKIIWGKWKLIAAKIALFQARLILSVFYFTIFLPFAFAVTYFTDILKIKKSYISTWSEKTSQPKNLTEFSQQF